MQGYENGKREMMEGNQLGNGSWVDLKLCCEQEWDEFGMITFYKKQDFKNVQYCWMNKESLQQRINCFAKKALD